MFNTSESIYRRTAAEGATVLGLLLVVYDTLSGDLRRAGAAVAANNISARCDASNHALLLLGHLESWAAATDDRTLADSLLAFYAHLRSQVLALQAHGQPGSFFALAALVEETRATWQGKGRQLTQLASPSAANSTPPVVREDDPLPRRSSWSA